MKQIWPNYSYSPATNVLTLTGLNIDRDQLLLVAAPERGRIMYNFADSAVTASAYTAGANTALTLVASTAGLTTTASLVIYYDDQLQSTAITISNFPATQTISGTVTASNLASVLATYESSAQEKVFAVNASIGGQGYVSDSAKSHITNSVTIGSLPAISGTVTVGNTVNFLSASDSDGNLTENIALAMVSNNILGITNALPAGTNRIGVVTIGAGTVTIGAGTAQIGSVTASISGTVPVSISSVTVGNSVTIGSLPAISGTVTANINAPLDEDGNLLVCLQPGTNPSTQSISGTVTANTFALQGTAVTTSNFTSTTASTVLANYNATREVLTIFNEGAGNLHICAGATCTTIAYQVRLSAGDYYEVPNHQTTITHSAVFATAGTARVTEVS